MCQRHRQCPRLCSWSHVCQSHICWGQQGHSKCFKVLSSQSCMGRCASYFPLFVFCFRLKIWFQKLKERLRRAWSRWAGWIRKQKQQQKKRWVKYVFVYFLKGIILTPTFISLILFFHSLPEIYSTATWCRNVSLTVFSNPIFHRQMQYTTWLDIQSSLWTLRSWTKCSMM